MGGLLCAIAAAAITRQHAETHAAVGDEGGEGGVRVHRDAIRPLSRLEQAKLMRVDAEQRGTRTKHGLRGLIDGHVVKGDEGRA